MVLQFSYWDKISGRAAPIRYLLKFADVDFEEKYYPMNNVAGWIFDEKMKLSETQPCINLPYVKFDDGSILSCTQPIVNYIARNYNLLGDKSENTLRRMDMVNDVLIDLTNSFFQTICLKPKDHKDVLTWRATVEFKYFNQLEKSLAKFGNAFLCGDQITYIDILFFAWFSLYKRWCPTILKNFEKLENLYSKLMENEKLRSHYEIENIKPLTVQYTARLGMQIESSAKNPMIQSMLGNLPELHWGPEGLTDARC